MCNPEEMKHLENILKLATIEWASVKKAGTIAEASISKVSTISAN